jgi:hypothetical protein
MNAICGPVLTTVAVPLIGNSVNWLPNPVSVNRECSRLIYRKVGNYLRLKSLVKHRGTSI